MTFQLLFWDTSYMYVCVCVCVSVYILGMETDSLSIISEARVSQRSLSQSLATLGRAH